MVECAPRYLPARNAFPENAAIQGIFRQLANEVTRTASIADEIAGAFAQGSKVLALSERTEHLGALHAALVGRVQPLFLLHGRQSKKQRASVIAALNALDADVPRVLLASGKLVGEGFDHPPLDTLVLTMPISWKGTLQQYAGRLHREQAGKQRVRIIDFIDARHPSLLRMWERRQRGYRTMRHRTATAGELSLGLSTQRLCSETWNHSVIMFPRSRSGRCPGWGDQPQTASTSGRNRSRTGRPAQCGISRIRFRRAASPALGKFSPALSISRCH